MTMKFSFFHKKAPATKAETPKVSPGICQPADSSSDTAPHAKEGYFVSCSFSYGESVDFINEKHGIRKPLIRNHAFVGFPGVDETVEEGRRYNPRSGQDFSDWMKYVERTPIDGYIQYNVLFSCPDGQGQTKVLWMLQPHDTPDESGFGVENIPEITLVTFLDENGDYTGPFRLEKVAW